MNKHRHHVVYNMLKCLCRIFSYSILFVCSHTYICYDKDISIFLKLFPVPDHTMVSFVKPNLLGTLKEFKNRFANPITNGQCRDSTPMDVRVMKNRAHILHEMLSGTVQVSGWGFD